jgi:crotonobetainyl-CoA:carnitine CoA-transferase CaiB-like acyl-CoA transferase
MVPATSESSTTPASPLHGVRVLDMTTTLMGPYATMMLAQLGADVIKVEPPGGDAVRRIGAGRSPGMGPIYLNANVGKRAVTLDLKQAGARDALSRLLEQSDVFAHYLRPMAAAALGLGPDTVADLNPTCIYCCFRGFDDGPYADEPAYDDVIQAVSGVAATQGRGGPPQYVATPMVDKTVGLAGAVAIMAALHRRAATGSGEVLTVPMFEFMASFMLLEQQGGRVFDPPIGPSGYARTASQNRKPYATRDGHLSVVIYTDAQWQRFFELAGRSGLTTDDRFKDIGARTRHIDELYGLVAEVMTRRTTADWLMALRRADIPVMPLRTVEELFDDPHLRETGFFRQVEHPSEGSLVQARFPLRFSHGLDEVPPAPRLGQHTRSVLQEIGLTDAEIAELERTGAAQHPPS